jgi:hypothetical protein
MPVATLNPRDIEIPNKFNIKQAIELMTRLGWTWRWVGDRSHQEWRSPCGEMSTKIQVMTKGGPTRPCPFFLRSELRRYMRKLRAAA